MRMIWIVVVVGCGGGEGLPPLAGLGEPVACAANWSAIGETACQPVCNRIGFDSSIMYVPIGNGGCIGHSPTLDTEETCIDGGNYSHPFATTELVVMDGHTGCCAEPHSSPADTERRFFWFDCE